MRIRTLTTVRVPAGTELALTKRQLMSRLHLVESLDLEGDLAHLVVAKVTLEFKAGEILIVPSIPKDWAGQVEALDDEEEEADGVQTEGPQPEAPEEEMNSSEGPGGPETIGTDAVTGDPAERTAEVGTGADASAPEPESTLGMADPAQDAGGETGAVLAAPATSKRKPKRKAED